MCETHATVLYFFLVILCLFVVALHLSVVVFGLFVVVRPTFQKQIITVISNKCSQAHSVALLCVKRHKPS